MGHVNVQCERAEVRDVTLMMGKVGWGEVGHVNARVNLLRFLLPHINTHGRQSCKKKMRERFCMPGVGVLECGLDSLLIRCGDGDSSVQKLGESHGLQTARSIKMTVRCGLGQLRVRMPGGLNYASPKRNTHFNYIYILII